MAALVGDQDQRAGIQLDDKVVEVWYVHTTPKQDWMACVREIVPEEKYELIYRFRNYKSDKVFDSGDEKNWYRGEVAGTRQFVILHLREMAKRMAKMAKLLRLGGESAEYLNDKGFDDFWRRFQDAPMVYCRTEGREKA